MRFACRIIKATDTLRICNTVLNALPRQQWVEECASMSRYTTLPLLSIISSVPPSCLVYISNCNLLWPLPHTLPNLFCSTSMTCPSSRQQFFQTVGHFVIQRYAPLQGKQHCLGLEGRVVYKQYNKQKR